MTYKGKQEIPPWVIHEAERKLRRKPGPKPKSKVSKPKVHVKINLTGSAEFDIEGNDAVQLTGMLERLAFDEILDFLDPQASGIKVMQEIDLTAGDRRWLVDEAAGTMELNPWIPPRWEWYIQ